MHDFIATTYSVSIFTHKSEQQINYRCFVILMYTLLICFMRWNSNMNIMVIHMQYYFCAFFFFFGVSIDNPTDGHIQTFQMLSARKLFKKGQRRREMHP
ncbi:hypothetical protein BDF20DRAFT_849559 [Mycotypha africana]|uniref:uncharacterized protein n=1 Tax=Mycotypha africana TaxID=64632 RepID=UPI00230093A3|nr:uncharacterized protein BDF20DRAFT_849559 [Mycotypha africana]KAI8987331.1 hypothetical protein BDF20DRAFT_849559 [Mycotypha africana]